MNLVFMVYYVVYTTKTDFLLYISQYYTSILEERVMSKQIAQNELGVIIKDWSQDWGQDWGQA